jgi:hypothetical protein
MLQTFLSNRSCLNFRIKLNNDPCLPENAGKLFCARAGRHNV